MRHRLVAAAVAFASIAGGSVRAQQPGPIAAEARVLAVRVHGNHTTPDADVLAIAGVAVGTPVTSDLVAEVTRRLDASGRFRRVDVRTRFASIADPSAILLVIVVDERAGIALDVPKPGPLRRLEASTMWLPVLRREDGYGFTYGVRFAFVDLLGRRSRIGVPLTWGGERRAGVELEHRFTGGPLTRVTGGIAWWRREHPALDIGDRRIEGTVGAERSLTTWLLVRGHGSLADVTFGDTSDTFGRAGVTVIADTRHDPMFPRNAVFASVGIERLWFEAGPDTSRLTADLRGFAGLVGQSVLAVRVRHDRAGSLPVFEQALLGGADTLRGFRAGHRYDDRLLAGSAEVRVPLSSPLTTGRFGVAAFVDTGTVYGDGRRLSAARFDTGVGAGLFLQFPVVAFRVDVARGLGAGTRTHVTLGVGY